MKRQVSQSQWQSFASTLAEPQTLPGGLQHQHLNLVQNDGKAPSRTCLAVDPSRTKKGAVQHELYYKRHQNQTHPQVPSSSHQKQELLGFPLSLLFGAGQDVSDWQALCGASVLI